MVGATGIEPVTPTMSTLRPQRNARKIRHFWRHQPSFPAPCCLCVHGFRFSRVKEHYVVSTRAAGQTRTRHGWHSPRRVQFVGVRHFAPQASTRPQEREGWEQAPRLIRVSPMPPYGPYALRPCGDEDIAVRVLAITVPALLPYAARLRGAHASGFVLTRGKAAGKWGPRRTPWPRK